jgi:hypothetical protein
MISVAINGNPPIIFRVAHLRPFEGRNLAQKGGFTVLVESGTGRIFMSRCHENDTYSRKTGIKMCLDRYVKSFFGPEHTVVEYNPPDEKINSIATAKTMTITTKE